MSDTHFEVSKKMVYSFIAALLVCIVSMGLYVYESDKTSDRKAIKTNQEAIQVSTKEIQINRTDIKVDSQRMDGHVGNKTAHGE